MKWAIRLGLLALLAVGASANAKADSTEYSYILTGPGTDVTFDLPEFPTVSNAALMGTTGMGFFVTPTDLVINGSASSDMLEFFNSSFSGGFEDIPPVVTDTPAFNLADGQLYSGNEAVNPQMSSGTFTLYACEDPACDVVGTAPYTLNTSVVSTPEPSSLLLFGVGLTGLVLLRKRYAVKQPV